MYVFLAQLLCLGKCDTEKISILQCQKYRIKLSLPASNHKENITLKYSKI